ncbi:MAG TPA: EVE domain-containing protein [Tepidisphaeraceae bacterium]|jgi:predicted RNA-binding protein with PUA-like domain|nr:EVE domain-containing protein [Tepidisphaeraceae bacterium]
MAFWLLKTEPSEYSWDDLVRDGRTVWDGVSNAAALIHLRAMHPGDSAIIYHTGDQRTALGLAEITSAPYPDPKADNPKLVVVDIKPKQKLPTPITLPQIKSDPEFAGWDLLRIGRLSVVPVPAKMWKHFKKLAGLK